MPRLAVLNLVGLARRVIGPHTPRLSEYLQRSHAAVIDPAFPAVTCSAQSNYTTGKSPSGHGIVANGWYDRKLAEVHFWKQSNHLVDSPKVWDRLRQQVPGFTCAKLFWWYNMYSTADYSITPRPAYPADGRKFFDIYSWPYEIRPAIKQDLGEFPFPTFWGPAAGTQSKLGAPDACSRWIAASARWIEERYSPTLNLVYLPHLDYNLQRFGSSSPLIADDLRRIDAIFGELLDFFQKRNVEVLVLSEYGITDVDSPVHLNRLFRQKGWLTIKEELGRELIDYGNSRAFAVADHQVAHIYVNDHGILNELRSAVESTPGVGQVLGPAEQTAQGIRHQRSGDLIAVARENAWFTYYYWLDDSKAPDFARTVDIHRKPGYDPVELFLDPANPWIRIRIARRLLQKKLGFRMLMDVIPLNAELVKGSHGCRPASRDDWPLLISPKPLSAEVIDSTAVSDLIERLVLDGTVGTGG
jgi:predicted AlkP superfamily pyrophosphatase or phosphodiesterase